MYLVSFSERCGAGNNTGCLKITNYRIFSLERLGPAVCERKSLKNIPLMAAAWVARERNYIGLREKFLSKLREEGIYEFSVLGLALLLV